MLRSCRLAVLVLLLSEVGRATGLFASGVLRLLRIEILLIVVFRSLLGHCLSSRVMSFLSLRLTTITYSAVSHAPIANLS